MIRLGSGGLTAESELRSLLTVLSLSTATRRPFLWEGFRKARGLSAEEAAIVDFFARLSGGRLEGGREGDAVVGLEPSEVASGDVVLELAGGIAAMPVARAALLPLGRAAGESTLEISGSTHAGGGETFEVTSSTWCSLLKRVGCDVEMNLDYAGFSPRGKGQITIKVTGGAKWRWVDWTERGKLEALQIVSAAPALPAHVQQRQAARARSGVAIAGIEPSVQLVKLRARSSGSVIAITGVFGDIPITNSAVSERGKSSEAVGAEASAGFRHYVQRRAVVPALLVETLLPYLALAEGVSRLTTGSLVPSVSRAAELVHAFTGRQVEIEMDAGGVVSCKVTGDAPYCP